jgi:hypothetical protein
VSCQGALTCDSRGRDAPAVLTSCRAVGAAGASGAAGTRSACPAVRPAMPVSFPDLPDPPPDVDFRQAEVGRDCVSGCSDQENGRADGHR